MMTGMMNRIPQGAILAFVLDVGTILLMHVILTLLSGLVGPAHLVF